MSAYPFDTYRPTAVIDPGDDGRIGTGDDGTLTVFAQDPATFANNLAELTNPARLGLDADRTYNGFEIIANKRFSNSWQFVGSLVISEMEVVIPTSESGGAIGGIYSNPNNLLNTRGADPLNQKYQVKLQGSYSAAYGIMVSGLYRYGSGYPYTRDLAVTGLPQGTITVFAEPRGSREVDSYNWIDLRVEKMFSIGGRRKVGVVFDVFNLTNASTVLQYGSRTSVNLGTPLVVTNPRIARFGARFQW